MNPKEEIFNFLAKSENLNVALEIVDYVEQLKLEMHKQFWTTFNDRMGRIVKDSEYASSWRYHPYPTRRILKDWEKTLIEPVIEKSSGRSFLYMTFGQGQPDDGYKLFWGVRWSTPPEGFDNTSLSALRGELRAHRITNGEPPNWIYWGYCDYRIYDAEFLIRMHNDQENFFDEIREKVWNLFVDIRPLLEKINQEVCISE